MYDCNEMRCVNAQIIKKSNCTGNDDHALYGEISHNTDEIALYTDEGKLSFNVNSTQITDDNGHELAVRYSHSLCRMNDLTSLNLLCDKELDFLGELQGITKLRLKFDGNTELLDTLPYMPELRDLTIVSYDEQIFLDKAFTDKIPNLEILYIWATMKNDFSVFAGLPVLTRDEKP